MPLELKIQLSLERICEWYEAWGGNVFVSFSGGKDSTALLHLVRSVYPEVSAVFFNTGVEYPEVVKFVKAQENVIIVKPKMYFGEIIRRYGYPVINKEQAQYLYDLQHSKSEKLKNSRLYGKLLPGDKRPRFILSKAHHYLITAPFPISHKCCDVLKKRPSEHYEKVSGQKPFLGLMAEDSLLRKQVFTRYGCNAFDKKRPSSNPLLFWTSQDVWEYIRQEKISYSPIYDMGYENTGCMFCLFGVHKETQPNKIQKLKETHPKYYDYCMKKLNYGEVLSFMNIPF